MGDGKPPPFFTPSTHYSSTDEISSSYSDPKRQGATLMRGWRNSEWDESVGASHLSFRPRFRSGIASHSKCLLRTLKVWSLLFSLACWDEGSVSEFGAGSRADDDFLVAVRDLVPSACLGAGALRFGPADPAAEDAAEHSRSRRDGRPRALPPHHPRLLRRRRGRWDPPTHRGAAQDCVYVPHQLRPLVRAPLGAVLPRPRAAVQCVCPRRSLLPPPAPTDALLQRAIHPG